MLNSKGYVGPEDEDEDNDFIEDQGIEIFSDVYDKDFDEVNYEGDIDDDSDHDAAEEFGY